jgi:hypothetical protein
MGFSESKEEIQVWKKLLITIISICFHARNEMIMKKSGEKRLEEELTERVSSKSQKYRLKLRWVLKIKLSKN